MPPKCKKSTPKIQFQQRCRNKNPTDLNTKIENLAVDIGAPLFF